MMFTNICYVSISQTDLPTVAALIDSEIVNFP